MNFVYVLFQPSSVQTVVSEIDTAKFPGLPETEAKPNRVSNLESGSLPCLTRRETLRSPTRVTGSLATVFSCHSNTTMPEGSSRTASPARDSHLLPQHPYTPHGSSHAGPSHSRTHSRPGLSPLASQISFPPPRPVPRLYNLHPGCSLCTFLASAKERIDARVRYSEGENPTRSPGRSSFGDRDRASFVSTSPTSPSFLNTSHGGSTGHQDSYALEVDGKEIVHWDEDVVIYRATGKEALCADDRHLIAVLTRHLGNVYDLVSLATCLIRLQRH